MAAQHRDLSAGPLGQVVVHLKTTTSTNDHAAMLARQGAPDGTLVIADEQTAGRGRRGRVWLAPPRSSLLCSLILRPHLTPNQAPRLTMLAAVAAVCAIRALGLPATIKWPNDVMVNERKVGGILTETAIEGDHLEYAIVGIGLNVNIKATDLASISPQATSLMVESGRRLSRQRILRLLLAEFGLRYQGMGRDGGLAVFEEWQTLMSTIGRQVTVFLGEESVSGLVEGVDADGALLLRQCDGQRVRVTIGEVS